MRFLSRLAHATYLVLLGGKALIYLAAGLFLLVLAVSLGMAWHDGWLVLVPIYFGGQGLLLIMQALEPFAGKRPQPKQPPKSIMQPRSDRTDPRRRHPARQNF